MLTTVDGKTKEGDQDEGGVLYGTVQMLLC